MDFEKCNGCNYNSYACLLRHDNYTIDICVCRLCLVKSMCYKTCDNRINIFRNLSRSKQQLLTDIQNIEVERSLRLLGRQNTRISTEDTNSNKIIKENYNESLSIPFKIITYTAIIIWLIYSFI